MSLKKLIQMKILLVKLCSCFQLVFICSIWTEHLSRMRMVTMCQLTTSTILLKWLKFLQAYLDQKGKMVPLMITFFRFWDINRNAPMKMFEDYHSKGEKNILPGVTIPAGQSGTADINQTLNVLFNHPNVGPFMSRRLIQHLVKSNPSPAYIKRVATIFNNNGEGVRGDLKAVVKAILLDPEARDCNWIDNPTNGKLIQPVERFTTLFKAFDLTTPSGKYWFDDFNTLNDETGQSFLASPSVFNFFSPFYAEDEFIAPQNLVSPEFQILNSVTAIAYINEIEDAIKKRPFRNQTIASTSGSWMTYNPDDEPVLDFSDELDIYNTKGIMPLLDPS